MRKKTQIVHMLILPAPVFSIERLISFVLHYIEKSQNLSKNTYISTFIMETTEIM